MSFILSMLLVALGASVEVHLAPDQPLPYVYIDDPLILEFSAVEDGSLSAHIEIIAAHRPDQAIEIQLPPIPIRAHGSRWHAVEDLPAERGFYTATITVTMNGETMVTTQEFCRVDRNANNKLSMVYAHALEPGTKTVPALNNAAIRGIRLELVDPDIEHRIQSASVQGFDVIIHVDCKVLDSPESIVNQIAERFCLEITRWEVTLADELSMLEKIVQTLRASGCTAPIALTVRDVTHLQSLLSQGVGLYVRDVVLLNDAPDRETIRTVQRTVQDAGYETWRIHVSGHGIADGSASGSGPRLIQQLLMNISAGVTSTGINASLIYDSGLGESLVYLNALAQKLHRSQYVGQAINEDSVYAPVYRRGNRWFVPVWSTGSPRNIVLTVGDAHQVNLTDALNNPLDMLTADAGRLTVQVSQTPVYLSGEGGDVIMSASRNEAGYRANKILTLNSELESAHEVSLLNLEIRDIISRIARDSNDDLQRADFLMLLRGFPELEQRWHRGELPQAFSVPALAGLAQLARALCTLEHQRETPFLEPLQDTLARCEEYQSLYLTSSTAAGNVGMQRGDWLLREVRRLMDEVEELMLEGSKEEATAVANLAEWRARGLEYASNAAPPDEAVRLAQAVALEQPQALQTAEILDRTISRDPDDVSEEGLQEPADEVSVAPGTEIESSTSDDTSGRIIHTVVRGDTPGGIATQYGVTLADFRRWNNLGSNPVIRIGEEYVIYLGEEDADEPSAQEETDLAEVDEEVHEDSVESPTIELEPGQPEGTQKIIHRVERGDNPSVIAGKYNVLLEDFLRWNNIDRRVVMHIGQEYTVYVPQ